jgi:hypothetical protein
MDSLLPSGCCLLSVRFVKEICLKPVHEYLGALTTELCEEPLSYVWVTLMSAR